MQDLNWPSRILKETLECNFVYLLYIQYFAFLLLFNEWSDRKERLFYVYHVLSNDVSRTICHLIYVFSWKSFVIVQLMVVICAQLFCLYIYIHSSIYFYSILLKYLCYKGRVYIFHKQRNSSKNKRHNYWLSLFQIFLIFLAHALLVWFIIDKKMFQVINHKYVFISCQV